MATGLVNFPGAQARTTHPARECVWGCLDEWCSAGKEGERDLWLGSEVAQSTGDRSSFVRDETTQQANGEVPDAGEDLGAMAFPHLRSIFVERDITHPMQAVLDAPVVAIEFQESFG